MPTCIMCTSGGACLPVDCCFSELALLKYPTKLVSLGQFGHHHSLNITSHHDIAEK